MNSKFTSITSISLGILLVVFGSNIFLHFIPIPPSTGAAAEFMKALNATGYMFPLLGILEFLIGLMLLLKKWNAFIVLLLAPISVNILLFHLFLDIPGAGAALLVSLLNGILIYKYRKQYTALFI